VIVFVVWCVSHMCAVYPICVVCISYVWCVSHMCGVYPICLVCIPYVWYVSHMTYSVSYITKIVTLL
jgi:hypothetical protein